MTEQIAALVAERDRAREIAVVLEQQIAAVAELHQPKALGDGEPHAVAMCRQCLALWPCDTARVLIDDLPVDLSEEVPA